MIIFSVCNIWQLALKQASVFARFPLPLISEIVRSIHVYLVVKPICYISKRNEYCIAWDSTLHYYMVVFPHFYGNEWPFFFSTSSIRESTLIIRVLKHMCMYIKKRNALSTSLVVSSTSLKIQNCPLGCFQSKFNFCEANLYYRKIKVKISYIKIRGYKFINK